jgi:hypothetical protein
MQIYREQPVQKRIKALLTTLLFGVSAAFFLSLVGLYYYGPKRSYSIETILPPPVIAQSSSERENSERKVSQFVFDKIEFLYLQTGSWTRIQIDESRYRKFYELVAKDKSLAIVDNQIEDFFRNSYPATLTLSLKSKGVTKEEEALKKFQEVQFIPSEDYYRIQLLEKGSIIYWSYFYHPGIFQETLNIFKSDE